VVAAAVRSSDGVVAVALTIAIMRALRDRGVLSANEIDDVLAEASGRFSSGPETTASRRIVEQVRADLARDDAE